MPLSPDDERYDSPLVTRYAGAAMTRLFSPLRRARLWRELWIALAEAERALGLPISEAQVAEMRARKDEVDIARVAEIEARLRHDVMAHVHHYGELCPLAKPVIHLGATSAYVTDNADLVVVREGLGLLSGLLRRAIAALAELARRERARPCLAYTHLQPAQLTTVGKRAALWLQDLCLDLEETTRVAAALPFLGAKGTTGTQASFLGLFDGDHEKVRRLDRDVAARMGFARLLPVSGQTYPRKIDHAVLSALAGIAASASKMASDVRLLQGLGEMEEPFDAEQVGSSAMAYKRNPMRSERICSLARFVIVAAQNAPHTAAVQWLERTLDDSANRRLAIAECFLATDAILRLVLNVASGLRVIARGVEAGVRREIAFIATEDILMAAVRAGGDRQDLHERIRRHAMAARERWREHGGEVDLLERIAADPAFAAVKDEVARLAEPRRYVGRAPEQVDELLAEVVEPLLARTAGAASGGEEGAAEGIRV
jgi:adenylosuccinate lyase